MTPAQAYGHPDFVTDVPVQGPTDEGLRKADCWYTRNVLPPQTKSSCVDCTGGPIPMWAQQTLSPVRGNYSGIGDFGGTGALGFALGADPNGDVWTSLSNAQQTWVMNTLMKLDSIIRTRTGSSCATFGPSITAAGGCFKQWFNANYGGKLTNASGQPVYLSPTIVFDQPTLDALITVAGMDPQNFPEPYPGGSSEKKGLSTGAMVGIGAGIAAALAGIAIVATRKKKR